MEEVDRHYGWPLDTLSHHDETNVSLKGLLFLMHAYGVVDSKHTLEDKIKYYLA